LYDRIVTYYRFIDLNVFKIIVSKMSLHMRLKAEREAREAKRVSILQKESTVHRLYTFFG